MCTEGVLLTSCFTATSAELVFRSYDHTAAATMITALHASTSADRAKPKAGLQLFSTLSTKWQLACNLLSPWAWFIRSIISRFPHEFPPVLLE